MGGAQIDELPADISFGGYTLLKRLAVGGMAEIYLAREEGAPPHEFIVVKKLLKHIASHNGLVQMFLDEARVAATLNHPNIVRIFNVGSIGDQYFLSMEHLHGLDLARLARAARRRKKPLPMNIALFTCAQVAAALAYAHTKTGQDGKSLSIVHRDLSPHNVFVTFDGRVKLLDFGVAKAANALHRTKTGALIGKVAYMSPEHCQTGAIDARSDLFSLGIIMWELTLGRRLYSTKKLGEFEVLRRICDEPVIPPTSIDKNYPPEVEALIRRALKKDKDDRITSAAEFERQIHQVGEELGLELTREALARFLEEDMGELVERVTSTLRKLETGSRSLPPAPSDVPKTPSAARDTFPPHAGTPSGVSTGSRPSAISFADVEFEDEERTERIMRPTTQQSVRWKQLPTVPPPISGEQRVPELRSRSWLVVLALSGVLVAAVVAIVIILFL